MSLPFVKLYTKVLDSSIWVMEDAPTRLLWITMLAMSDADGFVRAPIVGIAARARITMEEAERGMERLTSPDPNSSSADHEGRRVEPHGPGCWLVLNRRKYWDLRTKEQADNAARQARHQARRKREPASAAVSSNATNAHNGRSRTEREGEREGDQDLPTGGEGFALASAPAPKAKGSKGKPKAPPCTDEQWSHLLAAFTRARQRASMPTQWGAYRDTATNRAIVGRIYREDYTAADVDTVLDYWAQGLVAGSHDPQWTTLEHLARSMGRYLQQAAGVGRGARSVRAINPLCEPLARSPPTDDGPAEPPEYMPDDPDDWMAIR